MTNNTTAATFYPFYEEPLTRGVGTMLWLIYLLIGTPLLLATKELKQNDKSLTLLDMVLLNCSPAQMIYHLLVMNIDFVRLWWGPLPSPICTAFHVVYLFNYVVVNLSLIIQTILRFLYHTIWKNIGYLNDEFFGHFFKVWTHFIALFWVTFSWLKTEIFTWQYCICIGQDSRDLNTLRHIPTRTHIPIGPVVLAYLNMGIFILIWLKLQWSKQHIRQLEAQQTSGYSNSTISLSLLGIGGRLALILTMFLLSFPSVCVFFSSVDVDLRYWPMNWLAYGSSMSYLIFHSLMIPSIEIVSVPKYRKAFWPLVKRQASDIKSIISRGN